MAEIDNENSSEEQRRFWRHVGTAVIFIFLIIAGVFSTYFAFFGPLPGQVVWMPIAVKHFPAVVGLPMAAIGSLFIVLILEKTSGPVEFEMPGLKLKGAAGPVVFWLVCFLGMAFAINVLWSCTFSQ